MTNFSNWIEKLVKKSGAKLVKRMLVILDKEKPGLMRKVGEIEGMVGRRIEQDEDWIYKQIVLWFWAVGMFDVQLALGRNNSSGIYPDAAAVMQQAGYGTRDELNLYFIAFGAAGRFKGWPPRADDPSGTYGGYEPVLFWKLFSFSMYPSSGRIDEATCQRVRKMISELLKINEKWKNERLTCRG